MGFAILALSAALLPERVQAFWPFSNADAAGDRFIPSSSTPALVASTNADPSASAPVDIMTSGGTALLPNTGPNGTVADVAEKPHVDQISVYVVREGDTLSEIADMFGVSINTIVWANNLGSGKRVAPGDTLIILPISGVEHTIKKGDTLRSLAKKYGGDADEIAEYNGLDAGESLAVGSKLIIPGGEIASPAKPSSKPSSGTPRILGGTGTPLPGYFGNPLPGGVLTQGVHGWNGVDIGAARGASVRAAADGTVIIARNTGWNGGYGNYVVITHSNGTQTLYSHLRSASVSAGQTVEKGQVIGYVGATGIATGPHLHFEVRGAANPLRNCPVGAACQPQ